MKIVCQSTVAATALVMLLASCAVHYHSIQPVSPMPPSRFEGGGFTQALATVESLQPTFSWKCVDSNETRYDIIIYKGVAKPVSGSAGIGLSYYVPGTEVYYREGIEGCSHHIEQPLESGTVYVWGVRTRAGVNVGPWSTYDFQRGLIPVKGLAQVQGANLWWPFTTPM
jgi:hypothetical protein